MKLIILNGAVAAGKTTLGKGLTKRLNESGQKSIFYDLDDEVERINGNHVFKNDDHMNKVWLEARRNYSLKTNEHLKNNETVIMVGPFYQKAEIDGFMKYISEKPAVLLFTLNSPLETRLQRNKDRRWSNPEEDLKVQNSKIEQLEEKYGYHLIIVDL